MFCIVFPHVLLHLVCHICPVFLGQRYVVIRHFCSGYNLTSMINRPTCFKNPEKPSCIDLILTNCLRNFQNPCAIETGLSDFHKLVLTVMKTTYKKSQPKIIIYRSYKYFSNESFREELLQIEANGINCDKSFKKFTS